MNYDVDLVIPAHDPARNLRRAISSATARTNGHVRVTVVCHNRTIDEFVHHWDGLPAEQHVRALELRDGIRSPAGAFDAGLDAATAPWVSVMGSDDAHEPGAFRSWVAQANAQSLDYLMARVLVGGTELLTPRLRPFHRGDLDPVRDRLFYRTAPLGIFRRALVAQLGLRHTAGLPSGSDVEVGARLIVEGRVRLAARGTPRYVVYDDAPTRVTSAPYSASARVAPVHNLLDAPWVHALPDAVKRSLAIKLLRIHVLGAVRTVPSEERPVLAATIERLERLSPGLDTAMSRAERALYRSATNTLPLAPAGRYDWLLPASPGAVLDREGAIRHTAAAALRRRGFSVN